MTFAQWDALPTAERRHRLILYLARLEAESQAYKDIQEDSFEAEMRRLSDEENPYR